MSKSYFKLCSTLAKSIDPYCLYWNKWIESHKCFLGSSEKKIIHSWINLRNIKRMAEELQMEEYKIRKRLEKIASTLDYKRPKFIHWKEQDKAGFFKQLSDKEKFLNADFACHDISLKLYYNLCGTTCTNLKELMEEYTLEDLKMFRGFGKVSLDELMALLKANDCLDLLKRKIKAA